MKNKLLIPIAALMLQMTFAQSITVGKSQISLPQFKTDYATGLKNLGVKSTVDSYINFKLIQDFAQAQRADTTKYFQMSINQQINELKKDGYYPKDLEDQFLNSYLQANQKEYQVQVFFLPKAEQKKIDYLKIYNDVKRGAMTMGDAIKKNTKGNPDATYVKAGELFYDLDQQIQKLPLGGYSTFIDNGQYISFVKKTGERPTLGYIIFGTISYPNDANAPSIKENIYKQLNDKVPFQTVAAKYGSTDNERKNGGAVMGSPILPEAVYDQLKGLKSGEFAKEPVLLNDGKTWFIFNIYNIKPYAATTPQDREFFLTDMMNSPYGEKFYNEFINRMKSNADFKQTPLFEKVRNSYANFTKESNPNDLLFFYGPNRFTVGDLKQVVEGKEDKAAKLTSEQWKQLVDGLQNNFLVQQYNYQFEQRPEIKSKIDEIKKNLYSDYFYSQYISKEVENDPKLLADYYNAHKDQFVNEAAARGRVIIPSNEDDVRMFTRAIKKASDWDALKKEYKDKLDSQKQPVVKFNEGDMVKSAEVFTKYGVPFKTGVYTTKIGGRTLIIANDQIIPQSQMSLEDAKKYGGLIDDVKSELIQKVIAEQRGKTHVTVDPQFIADLEKDFKK